MKYYKFVWKDNTINFGCGKDAADAFTDLGFGHGALAALDYHERMSMREWDKQREEYRKTDKGKGVV